jgi:aspartate-semialdehyde dehydrogenase
MKRRFDLAVLGADSLVGAALMDLLAERRFPAGEVTALGLDVEDGASVDFAGHQQPIHRETPLLGVTVTALVPVSDGGRAAFQDLARETTALLNARHSERTHFAQQIAFNVHGQIGPVDASGATGRERQVTEDLRSLLGAPGLAASVHLVQAPLFYGYALTVDFVAEQALDLPAVARILAAVPGVEWHEAGVSESCPSPVTDAMASSMVQVARLRSGGRPEAGSLWITADNIRCAAAANGVDCAEILVRDYL